MLRYVLTALSIGLIPAAASAQLVVNGGFEAPVITDPCCNTAPPDALPGWTVTPNVNVVNGTFDSTNGNLAYQGNQYLDLVGQGGTGSISQALMLTPGQTYTLTFAYSHNLFAPAEATSASAQYLIDGLSGTVFHNTGTTSNLDWQIQTGNFVATGNDVLSFTNLTGGPNEGIFLDAIDVAPVPEPATWGLMLLGFFGIGFAMRRNRRAATLPQFG